jgi:hypothetical protein
VGEPYCDANANGRYDGIYVVGQVNHHAEGVLGDGTFVRTFVASDGDPTAQGTTTVAVASLDALGIFDTDVETARSLVATQHPEVDDLFVSADHNESSPDTIGLWGPLPQDQSGDFGATSGVNDYYMTWLAGRIALSVDQALQNSQEADLRVIETTAPTIVPTLNHWPTTNRKDDDSAVPPPKVVGRIDAWDPKVHILQAKAVSDGSTLFTLVDYDAHIQNLGHSNIDRMGYKITADWPQYFWADVEAAQGGDAIYLQGANGSIETPQVPSRGSPAEYTLDRSIAIGKELAAVVNEALADPNAGELLPVTPIEIARDSDIRIPVQNNLFKAAFAGHLFPHKQFSTPPTDPQELQQGGGNPYIASSVGVVKIGDLEFIANPGEAFPALMKGSHWGQNESCGSRENPPVPTYYSGAKYRWDMGLANDMIGYELPAWGWDESAAVYTSPDDPCSQQSSSGDKGHHHALESESLGPVAGNIVAKHLVAILEQMDGSGVNDIQEGRYLFDDGTLSRRPYEAPFSPDGVVLPTRHAVGIVSFGGPAFTTYALPSFSGPFHLDGAGFFVDFDGHVQNEADQTTRGMKIGDRTLFLNVWPDINTTGAPDPQNPPDPLQVSIVSSKHRPGYRKSFTLRGHVTGGTGCSAPYTVTVARKRYNRTTYRKKATVLTGPRGEWSYQTRARVNGSYRAVAHGGGGCVSDPSQPTKVRVRAKVVVRVPRGCRRDQTIEGRVIPNERGTNVILKRQRRGGGTRRWRRVDIDKLDGTSRFILTSSRCRGAFKVTWRRQNRKSAKGHTRFRF